MNMKKMIAAAVLVVMASLILTAYSVTGGFPGLDAQTTVNNNPVRYIFNNYSANCYYDQKSVALPIKISRV